MMFNVRSINFGYKEGVDKGAVVAKATYRTETWGMRICAGCKLDVTEMKSLKSIDEATGMNRWRSKEEWRKFGMKQKTLDIAPLHVSTDCSISRES